MKRLCLGASQERRHYLASQGSSGGKPSKAVPPPPAKAAEEAKAALPPAKVAPSPPPEGKAISLAAKAAGIAKAAKAKSAEAKPPAKAKAADAAAPKPKAAAKPPPAVEPKGGLANFFSRRSSPVGFGAPAVGAKAASPAPALGAPAPADGTASPFQEAGQGQGMDVGTRSVHQAILNEPELRQEMEMAPAEGHLQCSKCQVFKHPDEGTLRGRGIFQCKQCHNLDGRLELLTKGCLIGPMWRDLDADQKRSFRREYGDLQKAALKDKLTIFMTQKVCAVDSAWKGKAGTYYPMSVYKKQGYDNAFCSYIENSCPMRMEGPHPTYCLSLHEVGEQERVDQFREALWKPIGKDDGGRKRKRARSSKDTKSESENSADSSSMGSHSEETDGDIEQTQTERTISGPEQLVAACGRL